MAKTLRTSNSGMTLIEVMVSIAISAIVILASVSIGQMSLQTQAQNNISFQADIIRRNMVALISSDAAWNNTTGANSSAACLHNHTACNSGGASPGLTNQPIYTIVDAANTTSPPAYDVSPGKGFNSDGSKCLTGVTCPLTYTITWSALCGGPVSCIDPQVKVVVTPTYHPPAASGSQQLIFNANNYSATIYR